MPHGYRLLQADTPPLPADSTYKPLFMPRRKELNIDEETLRKAPLGQKH